MAAANGSVLRQTNEGEPKIYFSDSNECRFLEFLEYRSLETPILNVGEIEEGTISSWFTKDLALHNNLSGSIERPLRGQRLLILKRKNYMLTMKESFFKTLQHYISLPEDFWRILTNKSEDTPAFKYFTYKNNSTAPLGFHCNSPRIIWGVSPAFIFLDHNSETNITNGLLIVGLVDVDQTTAILRKLLDNRGSLPCHPVLFPLLLQELSISFCLSLTIACEQRLRDITSSLGQHEQVELPIGDPFEVDSLTTTRSLNSCGDDLSSATLCLRKASLTLDKMFEWSDGLNDPNESTERSLSSPGGSNRQLVASKVQFLKDKCNSVLLAVDYNQTRISRLIQVVFQFMAAKDAKVNIALAESSATIAKANKADSSSMKTIAVLGMFFLPGAFVAAIFAMPVFNWDGNGAPVVKTGFRYYWAVTIPLTLLVLLSWAFVMLAPWRRWLLKL